MPALIIRTELAVNEGAVEQFLEVADHWVEATRSETGTAGYDVYLDGESRRAIFLERYVDDDAFVTHRDALTAQARSQLYGTCALVGFEVYGDPGPEVRALLSTARLFAHHASK